MLVHLNQPESGTQLLFISSHSSFHKTRILQFDQLSL